MMKETDEKSMGGEEQEDIEHLHSEIEALEESASENP
jgi:hypothetical protein